MNRTPRPNDTSWENDPVWKLLDQSPRATAGPHFADDTVRAARLARPQPPWWSRLLAPLPLSGLAAAAACVIAVISLQNHTPPASSDSAAKAFAEIQEIAETEALLSAVDDLDKFSDMELVSLIGL